MKYLFITVFGVALLVVFGGIAYWLLGNAAPAKPEPEIRSLELEDRELVIETRDIDSVRVFAVAREGVKTEGGDLELGQPERTGKAEGSVEWRLTLPEEPLDISALYARGYNQEGKEVTQRSLKLTGYQKLYEALWAEDDQTLLQTDQNISLGETIVVEGLEITLIEIGEDARCRAGEECNDPGSVQLRLEARLEDAAEPEELVLNAPEAATTVGSYRLQASAVSPRRPAEGEIEAEDYEVELLVFKESKQ